MKKLLIYAVICGTFLLTNSCSSAVEGRFSSEPGAKYDTIYSLPEIGTTENYTFTTRTNDIIIDVKESQSAEDGNIGLSGFDGVNYFHEGKAIAIEDMLELMFIITSYDKNFVIRGEHPSSRLNIYMETQYEKGKTPDRVEIHREILDQLSVLFDFTLTEEMLPNTVYTFSVKDKAKTESFYVEMPTKYTAHAGLSDRNINKKENVYYCTFSQFLENRKVQGNFPFVDNTGLEGVFAVPHKRDEDFDERDMDSFIAQCELWGIRVSESVEDRPTIVLTFNT